MTDEPRPERFLQIGEAAERANLTQRTLRYYEEKGLLNPPTRMDGGFRLYSPEDIERIDRIKQLKELLGFSLAEIKEMLVAEDVRTQIKAEWRRDADAEEKAEKARTAREVTLQQLALIDQKMGGDILYISSKNSVFAGPNNIAYSATKADQAHQVRLLAAELGEHGVKVNGINPDGVVRGSGIFAGGWGAKRAAVYGVAEEDLGKYYAQRTLLKREVLPENIANAAFVLCTSDLSHTTGLHIPVDAGVAAAFLR